MSEKKHLSAAERLFAERLEPRGFRVVTVDELDALLEATAAGDVGRAVELAEKICVTGRHALPASELPSDLAGLAEYEMGGEGGK